jgi:hypothetical protein
MKAPVILIVLVALLLPHLTLAADTNAFSNSALGISIIKPTSWVFITPEQNAENLKRATLNNENLINWLREHPKAPLVGMMKYPEPFDDVNPNLRITVASAIYTSSNDLPQLMNFVVAVEQREFNNVKMITQPASTTLAGHYSYHAQFSYDLEVPDGRRFPDCGEIWLVPQKDVILIIQLEFRPDEKTGKRVEFNQILDSLKFD